MPIVTKPEPDSPLSQGDILKDVSFAVALEDGRVTADTKASYCLVISRNCKALREPSIIVAPIVPYPVPLAEAYKKASDGERLECARRLLAGLRDGVRGGDFSDALYLGTLDGGSSKRFAAQLTTLSTVQVPPSEKQEDRKRWIQAHRVWRLGDEFLRDLHVRLVLTFNRLGFDDYDWFSDADLEIAIAAGREDVLHCQSALQEVERAILQKEAENQSVAPQQRSEKNKKQQDVDEAVRRLQPYEAERTKRQTAKG